MGWLIGIGVVVFIAYKLFGSKGADKKYDAEKYVPPRKWGWERGLSQEEETALFRGLQAYESTGKSFYLGHAENLISFYEPPARVSLPLLAERFKALGPAAVTDPVAAVKGLLDGFLAKEEPGVLHLRKDWFPKDGVDGWDHNQFTEEARKILDGGSSLGLSGLSGWYSDENYGVIHFGVLVGPSPELDALRAAGKYEQMQAAESIYKNNLVVDLSRVLDRYRALRAERAELAPQAALKIAMVEAVGGQYAATTWSRVPARADEESVVRASVEGQALAA
jgi:hypothetical protein